MLFKNSFRVMEPNGLKQMPNCIATLHQCSVKPKKAVKIVRVVGGRVVELCLSRLIK